MSCSSNAARHVSKGNSKKKYCSIVCIAISILFFRQKHCDLIQLAKGFRGTFSVATSVSSILLFFSFSKLVSVFNGLQIPATYLETREAEVFFWSNRCLWLI